MSVTEKRSICHLIFQEECYFKGDYLKRVLSKERSPIKFKIISDLVYVAPDEIHEDFVEICEKLTML